MNRSLKTTNGTNYHLLASEQRRIGLHMDARTYLPFQGIFPQSSRNNAFMIKSYESLVMSTKKLGRFLECATGLIRRQPFIHYYHSHTNVGDLFNLDIVRFYGKSEAVRVPNKLRSLKHYLILGSIAQHANKNSVLLGAGFIEANNTENNSTFGTVRIVRGEITRNVVQNKRENQRDDILLGDPGLLIARVYKDVKRSSDFEFGLILHYAETDSDLEEIVKKKGGKIIRVDQSPKDFVHEISMCKCILSSSLHGIIFSDSLRIPNVRIKLTNRIIGADYKFADYYSTTNRSCDDFVDFRSKSKETMLAFSLSRCNIAEYRFSISDMESCISENLSPKLF